MFYKAKVAVMYFNFCEFVGDHISVFGGISKLPQFGSTQMFC
jgi:hypothetical protein